MDLLWPPITIRGPCRRKRSCEGMKLPSFANARQSRILCAAKSIRKRGCVLPRLGTSETCFSPGRVGHSGVRFRQVKVKQLGRRQKGRTFSQILGEPVLATLVPIEK